VLEDLHWADESTLALLTYVANRIAQLPAVIIGTHRSGYLDDNPVLVRTLELFRLGVRPLKLSGLSKDAVAQMLHEVHLFDKEWISLALLKDGAYQIFRGLALT
jgi:predicted ATPase